MAVYSAQYPFGGGCKGDMVEKLHTPIGNFGYQVYQAILVVICEWIFLAGVQHRKHFKNFKCWLVMVFMCSCRITGIFRKMWNMWLYWYFYVVFRSRNYSKILMGYSVLMWFLWIKEVEKRHNYGIIKPQIRRCRLCHK